MSWRDQWAAWVHAGHVKDSGPPGTAPYASRNGTRSLCAATKVEKKLAAVLGVRWSTYDRDTDRLYDTVKDALHAPE